MQSTKESLTLCCESDSLQYLCSSVVWIVSDYIGKRVKNVFACNTCLSQRDQQVISVVALMDARCRAYLNLFLDFTEEEEEHFRVDGECGFPRPVSRLLLHLDILSGQKWERSLVWFLVSQLSRSLLSLSCRSAYFFLFKYHLILLIQYFSLVYDNINYFTCIFSRLILVGIREPKSTRWLADE